jgi:hypothetical protein
MPYSIVAVLSFSLSYKSELSYTVPAKVFSLSLQSSLLMIQRVYIDTSVLGGIFDEEFQIFTNLFFSQVFKKEIRLITSDLLEAELVNAPDRVSEFYRSLPKEQCEFVVATTDSDTLAEQYIAEKVVGMTASRTASTLRWQTLSKADVLARWNFQHIVNLKRIRP